MQEVLKTYLELQQIDGERLAIEKQLAKYPAMREDLAVTLTMAKDAVARLEADDQQGELDRHNYEKELAAIEPTPYPASIYATFHDKLKELRRE